VSATDNSELIATGDEPGADSAALPADALAMLRGWDGPTVELGSAGVAERVLNHAASCPVVVAVRDGRTELTYAELATASATLAAELAGRGVGRGDIVAVQLPRGCELVVALLAVLRTGAAYCVLDVRWPVARRRQVVDHVGPVAVISDGNGADGLGVPNVGLPVSAPAADESTGAAVLVRPALDDGCCVYFTSGSTGSPKGALSTHRAVLRTVLHPPVTYPSPPATMLSTAAVSWDAFTLEVWYPLVHGGTTDQACSGLVTPQELRAAVCRGVTSCWLTASLFNIVVDEDVDACMGLSTILTGGERLSPSHVRAFLDRHPGIALVNGYGPVEASVFVTTHAVRPADCDAPSGIPVGRAMPNTRLLVVQRGGARSARRVGVGVTGELLVAGDGLAAGYLGEHPADAFAEVTVDGEDAVRVYRTGDLVRWRGDGVLEYVGRADRQLKIRGQRVEPAELEHALVATGLVRRCAVVPILDDGRPSGLAAYAVPATDELDVDRLLGQLRAELPDVLVPRAVMVLDELPLGPTGKIDVSALPPTQAPVGTPPDAHAPTATDATTAAEAVRAAVARRAAEVLGVAELGVDTDLRAAGLDSLGAIRVSHRLLRHNGLAVGADLVLRGGTPAGVAALADHASTKAAARTVADAGGLTDGQIALWLDGLVRPEHAEANVVLLGYRFSKPVDVVALAAALSTVCARHDALRTTIAEDDDGLPTPVLLDPDRALSVHTAAWLRDAEPLEARAAALAGVVDLANGPLVVARIDDAPDGLDLTIGVHHACFDGHSEALLAAEVSACLRGDELPPVRAFTDTRVPGDTRDDTDPALAAWVPRLAATHDLHWPGGAAPEPAGAPCAVVDADLPAAVVSELGARARRAAVTPFVFVLRAVARAIRNVTGDTDFCIGVPTAGRDDPSSHDTIGYFVEPAVVPVRAAEMDGPVNVLAATWDQALVHRSVGVADLARRSGRTGRERSSLFQAQFVWQNTLRVRWDVPGVDVTPLRLKPATAQFEMTLEFWPREDGSMTGRIEYDTAVVIERQARDIADSITASLANASSENGAE
jgi:mycobactin peptide synthetase MbtE